MRPGRPRGSFGPIGRAILDVLRQRPATTREVAHALQLSVAVATDRCAYLREAGAVVVVGRHGNRVVMSVRAPEQQVERPAWFR